MKKIRKSDFIPEQKVRNTNMKPEHHEFLKRIGGKIEKLRKEKKIKINRLVQETLINRNAYRELRDGKTYFKISAILKILDYYQVNYYDFLKKIDEENAPVGAKKPK